MLDPIVQNIIEYLAKKNGPKIWEQSVEMARKNFAEYLTFFGPKAISLANVSDRYIPGPAGDLRIRLYRPSLVEEPLPLLVFFHGGGFIMGSIETHDGLCRLLSNETRLPLISVDYRLAPENKWPAAKEDCIAAFKWIKTNHLSLGIDPDRVVLIGDSSGGHLVALVSQWAKASGISSVVGQVLMFPGIDFTTTSASMSKYAEGYFLEKKAIEWYHELTLGEFSDVPLTEQECSGLPSAYFMLSECDPLYDQGLGHAERLQDAGVSVRIATYPDLVHCFIYLYEILPQAKQALLAACSFIKDVAESRP